MPDARAVIAGGGIGGLTAAVALHRSGWQVSVLERAPSLEPVGAGISLWPNGLRALDTIGVGERLRGAAAVAGPTGVRRPDGSWVARSDIGTAVRARFGAPLVVVHRAELIAMLAAALPAGAVRTATTVVSATTGGEPAVTTQTGEVVAGDVVIAADGIGSVLRELAFPGRARPRYAGYTAWRMVVPALDTDGPAFETWGRGGHRFAVLPLTGRRWYCYATAGTPPGGTGGLAELRARFGAWHDPIPRILATLEPEQVLHQDVEYLDPPLPALHTGRLVLLGDAAHAMTPDLGQGGGMAVEDAVQLAALLDRRPVEVAVREYTGLRLPRTTRTARRSLRAGRLYSAPHGLQLAAARLMAAVPGALLARALDPVLDWHPQ